MVGLSLHWKTLELLQSLVKGAPSTKTQQPSGCLWSGKNPSSLPRSGLCTHGTHKAGEQQDRAVLLETSQPPLELLQCQLTQSCTGTHWPPTAHWKPGFEALHLLNGSATTLHNSGIRIFCSLSRRSKHCYAISSNFYECRPVLLT